MPRLAVLVLLAAFGCEEGGGGGPTSTGSGAGTGSAVAVAPAKNPGGGFSADLAKKLDTAGTSVDPPRTNTPTEKIDTKAGSAAGSADAKVADAKAGSADTKAGGADAKAGSADAKVAANVEPTKPEPTKPEPTKPEPTKPEPTKVEPVDTKQGSAAGTAPKIDGSVVINSGQTPKPPVQVSAALKSIQINLLPNWERDVEGAGTISFVVKIPNKSETAKFVFNYGIEDAKAPADRDAYKKWLADQKLFITKDDRQQGVAWYLLGTDGAGKPAFRMVVVYGGQKLICYGSQYKDSPLGDLRDQTIIQARQICESLTL